MNLADDTSVPNGRGTYVGKSHPAKLTVGGAAGGKQAMPGPLKFRGRPPGYGRTLMHPGLARSDQLLLNLAALLHQMSDFLHAGGKLSQSLFIKPPSIDIAGF